MSFLALMYRLATLVSIMGVCAYRKGKKPNKRRGKGREREKVEVKGMCTITYQFCMACRRDKGASNLIP